MHRGESDIHGKSSANWNLSASVKSLPQLFLVETDIRPR